VDVGIQYLESWLRGNGCIHLQPDGGRCHRGDFADASMAVDAPRRQVSRGRGVTPEMIRSSIASVINGAHAGGKFPQAVKLFEEMTLSKDCKDFLRSEAYHYL